MLFRTSHWKEQTLLFRRADTTNSGTAVGAFALRDRLTVFRRALNGILHRLLGLALYTIRFDSHSCFVPFCSLLKRVYTRIRILVIRENPASSSPHYTAAPRTQA